MYPTQSPQQQQQWNQNQNQNQNGPPTSQPPPNWSQQPPNGQYAPRPNQIPPISQAVPQGPAMQTLQPQHPDQYRALPAPPQMYAPPYQQPQQMPYPPAQPAPRQRTAIACRYCRRRKIRCSGFDQSEDGRCTNCQRFSQECVFTPVSAQTQAFVPAHVLQGRNPPPNTQLYGAYGQPLPQYGNRDPYPPPPGQQAGQYPPPPQGYQQQPMYQQPPPQQGQQAGSGQKRSIDEPHTPTLPPPNPGAQAQMRGEGQQPYSYPDPSGMTPAGASPTSSTASFHSAHHSAQPYYSQPASSARRASPQSAYSYDTSRASSSPHALGQPGTPAPPTSHSLQARMPIREGKTPPPPPPGSAQANAQRQGVKIHDLVGPAGQQQGVGQQHQAGVKREERTSTDTSHGETTDGAAAASIDGVLRKEMSTKTNGVDAGVQTDGPASAKEQDS